MVFRMHLQFSNGDATGVMPPVGQVLEHARLLANWRAMDSPSY